MASAKKRPVKSAEFPELPELPEAPHVDETPAPEFADEVAALASVRIVDEEEEAAEPTLTVQAVNSEGEVIEAERPPELYTAEEFREVFRKLFDTPQHIPPGMPVVGPIFGPDWEPFAISPMTEPGFNATSDEVYAFLKRYLTSFLHKRENKVLLIGSFLVTQIYVAMSIIRARKVAAVADQEKDAGQGDEPSPVSAAPVAGDSDLLAGVAIHGG